MNVIFWPPIAIAAVMAWAIVGSYPPVLTLWALVAAVPITGMARKSGGF